MRTALMKSQFSIHIYIVQKKGSLRRLPL